MEMEDHHGISDLRQLISRAASSGTTFPHFSNEPHTHSLPLSDFMTAHHHHHGITPVSTTTAAAAHHHPYNHEMVVMGRHIGAAAAVDMLNHARVSGSGGGVQYQDHFNCDSTTTTATQGNHNSGFDGGDGGAARWPRQETLTLLEIRSRLDHKFKEANQKGPLWDEVARIMCEEHGYQRSGKKCREKFENLYKYYKKTKEGKAGRQDGKHYRFFRQLEALYGDQHNVRSHPSSTSDTHIVGYNPMIVPPQATSGGPSRGCDTSVSLSNSSDFETSSSEDELNGGSMESNGSMGARKKKRGGKRGWKAKIKEFIDLQMRKIMEKQEVWLDKMMTTLETREHERMVREEEWRKQEADRVEREHKFWANERAWIEARDSALMSALEKITTANGNHQWSENEVTRLLQLRTAMEPRFQQQCGFQDEALWDEIAAKMAYLGHHKTASDYKEKWENINKSFQNKMLLKDDGKKKRKEDYHTNNTHEIGLYMSQLSGFNNCEMNEARLPHNEGSSSSPSPSSNNSNVNNVAVAGNVMNDNCFKFFLGDHGDTLGWDNSNYGLNKLNKGDDHN